MRYCTYCVQPDTRPGITFNEDGLCGACQWEREKVKIDWDARLEEAKEIAKWAAGKCSCYDCVVGVSGGKDSTRQALWARDTLGLRPLLVNAAPPPDAISEVGRHNVDNLKLLGFDMIQLTPDPVLFRKMARMSFEKFASNGRIAELYLYASSHIIADKFDIPLIIQGENSALTLGTSGILSKGGDSLDLRNLDTLSEGIKPFVDDGIDPDKLFLYEWNPSELKRKGTRGMYMQYYDKYWSPRYNYKFSKKYGFLPRPRSYKYLPHHTGTPLYYMQCDGDGVHVNQWLKYVKFGFGQTTDAVCYGIREGMLSRGEAIRLVMDLDGECSQLFKQNYCDYIGITLEHLHDVAEEWRGDMFDDNGQLIDPIWKQGSYLGKGNVDELVNRLNKV